MDYELVCEDAGLIPGLAQCHKQHRSPMRLRSRKPAAVAPILPQAWELPYSKGVAIKRGGGDLILKPLPKAKSCSLLIQYIRL